MEQLTLQAAVAKEIDGIEMGVLEDGTPYLSGRGLARMCGVAPSAIIQQASAWQAGSGRTNKFGKLLTNQGFDEDLLYIKITQEGKTVHAYNDAVSLAFLEYYAFEAGTNCTDEARQNYRTLARKTFKDFVYSMVGYDPRKVIPEAWKHFHDRMLLNTVPVGYFSIFKEMSEIMVFSIQSGLRLDAKTIPDISVGSVWGKHWRDNDLDYAYSPRVNHPHIYPDYFPQAGAHDAWVYPVDALGEFRKWLHNHYLPNKFPSYLKDKVKANAITTTSADLLLKAVSNKSLPTKGTKALPAPTAAKTSKKKKKDDD